MEKTIVRRYSSEGEFFWPRWRSLGWRMTLFVCRALARRGCCWVQGPLSFRLTCCCASSALCFLIKWLEFMNSYLLWKSLIHTYFDILLNCLLKCRHHRNWVPRGVERIFGTLLCKYVNIYNLPLCFLSTMLMKSLAWNVYSCPKCNFNNLKVLARASFLCFGQAWEKKHSVGVLPLGLYKFSSLKTRKSAVTNSAL